MTRTRITLAIAFSILFALPILSLRAQEKPAATADSAAIKQSIATFIENFNRHDAHAVTMAFAEDADLTNVRGITTHGRKAIDDLYTTLYQGRLKDAQRKISVTSIRYLTPTIASVDGTWEMTGTRADDGSIIPFRHGMIVLVMTKQNNQWLITIYHEPEIPVTQGKQGK